MLSNQKIVHLELFSVCSFLHDLCSHSLLLQSPLSLLATSFLPFLYECCFYPAISVLNIFFCVLFYTVHTKNYECLIVNLHIN